MKEKISAIVVDRLVLKTMSDEPTKPQVSGGKAAFRRAEDSGFHLVAPKHGACYVAAITFVINSGYDPRVCFAGGVSRYRHAGSGWGSIGAQQI